MTPAYAAPEQIRGERVGLHTDVHALGVMLYELLAGQLPFGADGLSGAALEARILAHEAVRPSVAARAGHPGGVRAGALSRGAWADLDVLCLTAMHADPQRRYPSAEALARDLEHLARGEPLEARPDTRRYRLGKFVRRQWRPLGAAALVLVAGIGLTAAYTVRLTVARNAALAEAARAQRIQRFMLSMFTGGDESVGPADSLRVVTLVDRGVQEARALAAEPTVQAELYGALGGIYQQLGDLPRADSLLQLALARRRALAGNASPATTERTIALAVLRLEQARLPEAETLARDALATAQRQSPRDDALVASALVALGRVLQERGRYPDAILALERAVRRRSAVGAATPELAESLRELAGAHFYAGHLAVSDSLDRRVLAMSRTLYGARHPHVAEDLVNIGAIRFEHGEYAAAEQYYRQALDIVQGFYGASHARTGSALTMLGRALVYQQRNDEAEPILRRALAIQERVYGPSHPRVASALNDLGNIAVARGQLDSADARFRRMGDIYRAANGERHYLVGIAVSNRGGVALARKDYRGAEALYRDAVARFTAAQGPDHLNTAIARVKLGRALARQTRWAEAEREALAGYQLLITQSVPATSFAQAARRDLAAAYDALGQPTKAARFRAEIVETERTTAAAGGGG